MTKNLGASIRARLKQHADAHRQDFNLTLTHYGLERLLYRMSVSRHASNFLLKGALLFSIWYDTPHRSTRDVDLLGFGADDVDTAVASFKDICEINVDDAIAFDTRSIQGAVIRKEAGYGGVRVDIKGKLDGARISLQVDIGFGDAVTPGPQSISYPVILKDLPAPQLRAYPKCTVIAEKYHAICLLGLANTRMKDYFDLWVLLGEDTINPSELRDAMKATFKRRGMAVPTSIPTGLTDSFANDAVKRAQWLAFTKKNGLDSLPLASAVERIKTEILRINAQY